MRNAIVHPVHLGAVALLVVNDHMLKYLWPGTVTGKLSDVAGVFVIAVVAAVLVGNRPVGLFAAGLGFIAIKTSSTAAALAAPLLGGTTLQDPTDLLALGALIPAAYHLRRFDESTAEAGDPAGDDRFGGWMRLAVIVSGTATVLTVTATSRIRGPGFMASSSSRTGWSPSATMSITSAPMGGGPGLRSRRWRSPEPWWPTRPRAACRMDAAFGLSRRSLPRS